jgi:hypothetical protein
MRWRTARVTIRSGGRSGPTSTWNAGARSRGLHPGGAASAARASAAPSGVTAPGQPPRRSRSNAPTRRRRWASSAIRPATAGRSIGWPPSSDQPDPISSCATVTSASSVEPTPSGRAAAPLPATRHPRHPDRRVGGHRPDATTARPGRRRAFVLGRWAPVGPCTCAADPAVGRPPAAGGSGESDPRGCRRRSTRFPGRVVEHGAHDAGGR